jgi:soluble epoxide hydrolase/lipid-phosphate phosphatase
MDGFDKKTLKTSRGYTYTYYTSAGDSSLPTLLFQHGFPDHAGMWQQVASGVKSTKHPIIIPDMLGYDGTDKPTDPAAYKFELMTKDIIEILDAEGAQKCISIGHDWGSTFAARLYQYHPERVAGLVNINVPYTPLSRSPFDLDAVNAMTEKIFGYPIWMYWYLFTAPDGAAVLEGDLDLLHDMLHVDGEIMKTFFCSKDGMRGPLEHKVKHDFAIRPYAQDPAFKKSFVDRMRRDGFEAPLCWYKAMTTNVQSDSDAAVPDDRQKVNVPTLYFGGTQDCVCRPEMMHQAVQNGLLPHLENAGMIEAGHWTPYEKPDEVVAKLEPWLKKNYAK